MAPDTEPAAEHPNWPAEGTGRGGLMAALRGDAESGTGMGAGMFEDLHAAFSGGKQAQIDEREAQKLRRQEQKRQGDDEPNRPDLDSGTIRIKGRRPVKPTDRPGDPPGV
jgi:hypothetical protein